MKRGKDLSNHRSASQFSIFEMCPLKFKYKYEDDLPENDTIPLTVGKAVHKILENCIDKEGHSLPELLSDAFELLDMSLFEDESQEMTAANKMSYMFENFREWWNYNHMNYEVVATEQEFEIPGDPPIKGVIDLVLKNKEGDYEIIDYKTGKATITKNSIKRNLQLAIYCKGVNQLYGKYPVKATLFYLKFNKLVSVKPNEINFDRINNEIDFLNREINNKKFPAKTGYWCNFCSYKGICPEWK